MKKLLIGMVVALLIIGCGQSYDETKRLKQEKRTRELREDSAALKVAVMPTLDCLPLYVAEEREMFDTIVDIRLKCYTAQMDCDTALQRGRVEMAVSDLVRAERMKGVRRQESGVSRNMTIGYVTATNAYWLLIGNRNQRITNLSHLDDRMLAMTRYSVTDLLGDLAVDSAKLKTERVFRIQVNDVNVRLDMLENNEMDALLMTQPQVTQALLLKHHVLLDTRQLDMQMGVIVEDSVVMSHPNRQRQREVLIKGYNMACDSLNHFGVKHYSDIIRKYYKLSEQALRQLPDTLTYEHVQAPREQDVAKAKQWLSKGEKVKK
ncbi:MAG: ABC transporter substrate-binding protein [Prevotella sp.]|jgi:NitT/TauT family transport system substrate-binding protein|nr:ABC transporter substrate-binding protein [Prevotella sp.]